MHPWGPIPEHPAYDFLTGGSMKPFYVVFGGPENVKNLSKDDLDDQAQLEENKE